MVNPLFMSDLVALSDSGAWVPGRYVIQRLTNAKAHRVVSDNQSDHFRFDLK
jgi:hypothetical protein